MTEMELVFSKYAQAVIEEIRKIQGGRLSSLTADDIFPRQVFLLNTIIVNASLPKPHLRLIAKSILNRIALWKQF
jgi:hypothetical protein